MDEEGKNVGMWYTLMVIRSIFHKYAHSHSERINVAFAIFSVKHTVRDRECAKHNVMSKWVAWIQLLRFEIYWTKKKKKKKKNAAVGSNIHCRNVGCRLFVIWLCLYLCACIHIAHIYDSYVWGRGYCYVYVRNHFYWIHSSKFGVMWFAGLSFSIYFSFPFNFEFALWLFHSLFLFCVVVALVYVFVCVVWTY